MHYSRRDCFELQLFQFMFKTVLRKLLINVLRVKGQCLYMTKKKHMQMVICGNDHHCSKQCLNLLLLLPCFVHATNKDFIKTNTKMRKYPCISCTSECLKIPTAYYVRNAYDGVTYKLNKKMSMLIIISVVRSVNPGHFRLTQLIMRISKALMTTRIFMC